MQTEQGVSAHDLRFSTKNAPTQDWKNFFVQNLHRVAGNQGKVHLLLVAAPLPRIQDVYQTVFEKILNERISSKPVAVSGG